MKAALKTIWSAFNRWRKRHWLLRVILLLVFLAHWVIGALVSTDLWSILTEPILAESEPPTLNAMYRYNRVSTAKQLQRALMAKIDKNEDGVLDERERQRAVEFGLDPSQLTARTYELDLAQIVAAAQRADLLPPSSTARVIRREAWDAAQAETERVIAAARKKIEALMQRPPPPDFLKWTTWKNGIMRFIGGLRRHLFFLVGNPSHWVPFFISVYLVALIMCLLFRGKRVLAAGVVFVLICVGGALVYEMEYAYSIGEYDTVAMQMVVSSHWLVPVGDAMLILAAVVCGVRRAGRLKEKRNALAFALLGLAVVLLAWGLTPGLKLPARYPGRIFAIPLPYLMGAKITRGVRIGIAAMGAVALVVALSRAIITRNRLRRNAISPAQNP